MPSCQKQFYAISYLDLERETDRVAIVLDHDEFPCLDLQEHDIQIRAQIPKINQTQSIP